MSTAYHGLLNLYKPAGLTSRDVVDRVQRLVRPAKAGHAGTLDPIATGVLVVCVGNGTRLIEYVQQAAKRYRGTFQLGVSSPTEDIEGELTALDSPPQPTLEAVTAAAERFVGPIMQRPPAFSALKVDGKRAYALARRGQEFELQPRPVTIHALDVVAYDYPLLTLDISCGAGTYVRSLGRDLAEALGTSAVMTGLERTAIGPFTSETACPIDRLSRDTLQQWLQPLVQAVAHLPRIVLDEADVFRISRGLSLVRTDAPAGDELAACDAAGQLLAILGRRADGSLGPVKNVSPDGVYS
jgi:tRNA pseudouridine55 synthase